MTPVNHQHNELMHVETALKDWARVRDCLCTEKALKEGLVLSDKGEQFLWYIRQPILKGLKPMLVAETDNWDGTKGGREWRIHMMIYFFPTSLTDGPARWEVYSGDGQDGSLVGIRKTLLEAIDACQTGKFF
jgi:hypothetical protein